MRILLKTSTTLFNFLATRDVSKRRVLGDICKVPLHPIYSVRYNGLLKLHESEKRFFSRVTENVI